MQISFEIRKTVVFLFLFKYKATRSENFSLRRTIFVKCDLRKRQISECIKKIYILKYTSFEFPTKQRRVIHRKC